MNYLVGFVGETDSFSYADSMEEAEQIAETYTGGDDVGIWKLEKVGHRNGIAWEKLNGHAEQRVTFHDRVPEHHCERWTVEQLRMLRMYRCRGKSSVEIAGLLGRTPYAIDNCVSRYGL